MKIGIDPKVSIIIPHFNNFQIVNKCIESIQNINYKNYELIIVDNKSTDNSLELLYKKYKQYIIVESDSNLGYAGGCNLGATKASGEYLLFLNNETIHDAHFITYLIEEFNKNNNIASIQPKIRNLDKNKYFDYAGASGGYLDYLVYPYCRGRIFSNCEKDNSQYDSMVKVFWTSGTCFLTKKSIFEELDGFDCKLFAHMEEIDYCWKSYMAGYECWVQPKSIVYHKGGVTLNSQSHIKTYLNHRNSLILLLTNYKNLTYSIYLFIIRFFLEILSSIYDLIQLRFSHFLAHYKALVFIFFNMNYLIRRRKNNKKYRKHSYDIICEKNIISPISVVKNYFILKRKKFSDLNYKS